MLGSHDGQSLCRPRQIPPDTRSLCLPPEQTLIVSTPFCTALDGISNRSYIMVMKKMAAAKFKEQCLSILDHLEPDGLVITKHGKPVARILPAERASADLIGAFRGRIQVKGDIQSTGVTWEAHG